MKYNNILFNRVLYIFTASHEILTNEIAGKAPPASAQI